MNTEILKQAIKKYGASAQIDMAVEESAELIQAINKLRRRGGISFEGVIQPSVATDVKYSELFFNLCSEVADVKIMIAQMELMLNKEAIDLAVERKIQRLEQRMLK